MREYETGLVFWSDKDFRRLGLTIAPTNRAIRAGYARAVALLKDDDRGCWSIVEMEVIHHEE